MFLAELFQLPKKWLEKETKSNSQDMIIQRLFTLKLIFQTSKLNNNTAIFSKRGAGHDREAINNKKPSPL